MNDELQSKLVEILSSVQSATKMAGDCAIEQLPDIAQSYVMYGRVTTLMEMLFGTLFVVAGFWIWNKVKRHIKEAKRSLDTEPLVVIFGTGVFVLIGGIITVSATSSAALVWLAPKVWLIKELASLVK